MKTLNVKSSAYPNGDYLTYKHGMPRPESAPLTSFEIKRALEQRHMKKYRDYYTGRKLNK